MLHLIYRFYNIIWFLAVAHNAIYSYYVTEATILLNHKNIYWF